MRGIRKHFLGTLKVSRLRKTKRNRTLGNWRRLKGGTRTACIIGFWAGLGNKRTPTKN